MKNLKIFEEFNLFDYDKILRILNKTKGWGGGCIDFISDFENSDYFKYPQDDHEYVEQFHIFLVDRQSGKVGGWSPRPSLPLGKWKVGPTVMSPTSWYSRST